MNSFVTSLIRTYVPIAVGGFIAWLATLGLQLDAETQTSLIVFLTGISQALYYLVARWIERKFPQIGTVLLGSSKAPVYKEKS